MYENTIRAVAAATLTVAFGCPAHAQQAGTGGSGGSAARQAYSGSTIAPAIAGLTTTERQALNRLMTRASADERRALLKALSGAGVAATTGGATNNGSTGGGASGLSGGVPVQGGVTAGTGGPGGISTGAGTG